MNDEQPIQSQDVENAPAGVSLNGSAPESAGAVDTASATGTVEQASATTAVDVADATGEAGAPEARDDQDAQMPGETDLVGADDAEPQIMQASDTSQAEGDEEAVASLPGADTVEASDHEGASAGPTDTAATMDATDTDADTAQTSGAADTMGETTAVNMGESASETGVTASAEGAQAQGTEGTESAEGEETPEEMVIHSARDPRLEDMAPNASMEDLLKASEQQYRTLKHGDVIEGSIMKLGRDEILVDIGAKTEGIIPSHELQSLSQEERDAMQVGDPVLVSVVQPENNEGHSVLSLDRARQERSWRELQKKFDAGEVIQAKVSGHNKGGLLVNLEGVRGFVPSSQISSMPTGEANKQAEMAKMQNQTLPLKIIEINRNRNRLILSERQAVQEKRESMRTQLLRELEHGQIRQGRVSSICDFGAFVDIGGADGLIHLSELSWKRVSHPSEVLHVGDVINVYVLSVDPNERKIALSLKRTQPEPWTTITENYHLGQIVRGTITQLTTFGAFARLEDGIEGLIHVSELAEGRVAHPKNVVKEGDVLDLKVIRIDPAKRRIGLSLKRVNEDAEGAGAGATGGEGAGDAGRQEGGEYAESQPMSQADMVEANSEEGREAIAQPERQPQQQAPRHQQPSQRREPQQPRQQQQQPRQQPPAADEEAEPMGALAQALTAHLRSGDTETEEEAPTPAPAATSTRAAKAAPAPIAPTMEETTDSAQPAAEVEASDAAEDDAQANTGADTDTEAVDDATDDATAEPQAGGENEGEVEGATDSAGTDDTDAGADTDADTNVEAASDDAADTDTDVEAGTGGEVQSDDASTESASVEATDSDTDTDTDTETDTDADTGVEGATGAEDEASSFATDDSIESGDMPTEDEVGSKPQDD